MALGIYFPVKGMTPDRYAAVHRDLAAAGLEHPAGRTFHAGSRVGDEIHVFDVWESEETFQAFGEHLMPILLANGIEPGEPRVGEIELLVSPD